jgi:hypothetical protein
MIVNIPFAAGKRDICHVQNFIMPGEYINLKKFVKLIKFMMDKKLI